MGYEFGYYGQYNRIRHVIESLPNVKIESAWEHDDLAMEDFGFKLSTPSGEVNVSFGEGDPASMYYVTNKDVIRAWLTQQIEAQATRNSTP